MADHCINPMADPERAAQEVILELCKSGTFGVNGDHKAFGARSGEELGDAIVEAHKKLTEHYKSLT
ncbi:hypothetical protein [Kushneria sp. TE3]|uniref:hypothetical protein n=1 Tax=Kushneria sp. TE3 TaxID=3449832 RepID=UPI003F688D2E